MRAFTCPDCHEFIEFEDLTCPSCDAELGFVWESSTFHVATDNRASIDGEEWFCCSNRSWGCNWLVAEDAGSGQCFADRLIRKRPSSDDTVALEKLATTTASLRMLTYQLLQLGLPVSSWHEYDNGLAFDLLSSLSLGRPVTIGHADGVITIDLAESLSDHRERLRINLGEPYRTMLGHFRHEVGHYYEMVMFEFASEDRIWRTRSLFGDERASYSEALERHYKLGPPRNWRTNYISEYATMHPYEDFAECFAHYLHITETLDTASWAGLELGADSDPHGWDSNLTPPNVTDSPSFESILLSWRRIAQLLNRINRSMGLNDLYPFSINDTVAEKLSFIHELVRDANRRLHRLPADLLAESDESTSHRPKIGRTFQ